MANPTECGIEDYRPVVVTVPKASEASITLNPRKQYSVRHDGESTKTGGAAITTNVYLRYDVTGTAAGEGANQCHLRAGREVRVGPGCTTLFMTAVTTTTSVTIIPREFFGHRM